MLSGQFTTRLGHLAEQLKRVSYLDSLAVYEHRLHGEVNADSVPVAFDECARLETLHQAGLACATITNQHDLEQVVEVFVVRAHHQIVGIPTRHSHRQVRDDDGGQAFGMLHLPRHSLSTPSSLTVTASSSFPSPNCVHLGTSFRPAAYDIAYDMYKTDKVPEIKCNKIRCLAEITCV